MYAEAIAYPALIDGDVYYSARRIAEVGDDYTAAEEEPHFMIAQLRLTNPDTLYVSVLHDATLPAKIQSTQRWADSRLGSLKYSISAAGRDALIEMLRSPERELLFPYRIGPLRRFSGELDMRRVDTNVCLTPAVLRTSRVSTFAALANLLAALKVTWASAESLEHARAQEQQGCRQEDLATPLADISRAQVQLGDLTAARKTLARARAIPKLTPTPELVGALARVGETEEALAMAASIYIPERDRAHLYIALERAQQGDVAGALDPRLQLPLVTGIPAVAAALVHGGQRDAARTLLAEKVGHYMTLTSLLSAQLELGFIDDAWRTTRLAVNAEDLRPEFAEAQIALGDFAGARATLDWLLQQDHPWWPTVALQSRLGDLAGAQRLAQQIIASSSGNLFEPDLDLARFYAASGDIEGAQEHARGYGVRGWYEIAKVQRMTGDVEGAKETAELAFRESLHRERSDAPSLDQMLEWSRLHGVLGDPKHASDWYGIALQQSRASNNWDLAVGTAIRIARAQFEDGDEAGARASALSALLSAVRLENTAECDIGVLTELFEALSSLPPGSENPEQR